LKNISKLGALFVRVSRLLSKDYVQVCDTCGRKPIDFTTDAKDKGYWILQHIDSASPSHLMSDMSIKLYVSLERRPKRKENYLYNCFSCTPSRREPITIQLPESASG